MDFDRVSWTLLIFDGLCLRLIYFDSFMDFVCDRWIFIGCLNDYDRWTLIAVDDL